MLAVDTDNTAAATLAVNGAPAKTIKKRGGSADLSAGDFKASQRVLMIYDGTNWQAQSVASASGELTREILASTSLAPATPNTRYTAIDGASKAAALQTDAGYFRLSAVAHF